MMNRKLWGTVLVLVLAVGGAHAHPTDWGKHKALINVRDFAPSGDWAFTGTVTGVGGDSVWVKAIADTVIGTTIMGVSGESTVAWADSSIYMCVNGDGEAVLYFESTGNRSAEIVLNSEDKFELNSAAGGVGLYRAYITSSFGARVDMNRSDATITSNELIAAFDGYGSDRGGELSSYVRMYADGDWVSGKPTYIKMGVAPVGDDNAVEGFRLDSERMTTLTADSTHLYLVPTADPNASPNEGELHADTDHKLYYYDGTAWRTAASADWSELLHPYLSPLTVLITKTVIDTIPAIITADTVYVERGEELERKPAELFPYKEIVTVYDTTVTEDTYTVTPDGKTPKTPGGIEVTPREVVYDGFKAVYLDTAAARYDTTTWKHLLGKSKKLDKRYWTARLDDKSWENSEKRFFTGTVEAGDVLRVIPAPWDATTGAVARTTGAYQQVLGVESGSRGSYKLTPEDPQRQVGMIGEVWVNVSDEGGDIVPGDLLVSATAPGVAMKADSKDARFVPGVVVGQANMAFTGKLPDREYGKIKVWLRGH